MTDAVTIALIGAIGTFLTTLLGIANVWLLNRTKKAMTTLEKNTNSMKDELVKVTGMAEFAKGLKQGQNEVNSSPNPLSGDRGSNT